MRLTDYDQKRVKVTDIFGESFTGFASHCSADYCMHEYGREEEAVIIGDFLIYKHQIAEIGEIEAHGMAELWTEHLILRPYRPEDAEDLHKYLGTDPVMFQYTGWNPYKTLDMAQESVRRYIESYNEEHNYSWVIDWEDVLVGTIGAYDYKDDRTDNKDDENDNKDDQNDKKDDRIEVGISIVRPCWGKGYASEALEEVLVYLTENEGISCVGAWCAAENIGSRKVMEKAGMKLVKTEKDGLKVEDRVYDKLIFEYRRKNRTGE